METKNERLKQLRKSVDMTMEELGKILGITKSGVSEIESGRRKVTEKHLKMLSSCILKNGKVPNIMWLRTGEGEMFAPKQDGIEEFLVKNHLNPKCREALEIVFGLPEPAQQAFADFVMELADRKQREKADLREQVKEELRAEVEKEVRAEMEAEKEDKEAEALHILLQAQIDRQKGDKGSTLVSGGTKSKEV